MVETFQSNGFESEKGSEGKGETLVECEFEAVVRARLVRHEKKEKSVVRVDDVLAADEKRSDLEFEMSALQYGQTKAAYKALREEYKDEPIHEAVDDRIPDTLRIKADKTSQSPRFSCYFD
ncbi:hypothetical protein QQ045_013384 [Rhodiola kirilowii]